MDKNFDWAQYLISAFVFAAHTVDMQGHGYYFLRPINIAMLPNQSNDTINSFFTLPHTYSAVQFLDIYFSSLPYKKKKKQKLQTLYF